MSTFNPDTFLNAEVTGALDTVFLPVPAGEYQAAVEKVAYRQTDKGNHILDITWLLRDDELMNSLGRDKITVRQSVFMDVTEQGSLDLSKGKNIQLGKVRDALGQNDPEKPWRPSYLVGATAMVTVTQRPDPNDPRNIYNDIKSIAAF